MVMDHGCLLRMKKTITEITAQKRNRRRVNISLNGSYAFSWTVLPQPGCGLGGR